MIIRSLDRGFVWTIAGIIVVGISLWGYIEFTIIQMDADAATLEASYIPTARK